jgi:hypothetical protein
LKGSGPVRPLPLGPRSWPDPRRSNSRSTRPPRVVRHLRLRTHRPSQSRRIGGTSELAGRSVPPRQSRRIGGTSVPPRRCEERKRDNRGSHKASGGRRYRPGAWHYRPALRTVVWPALWLAGVWPKADRGGGERKGIKACFRRRGSGCGRSPVAWSTGFLRQPTRQGLHARGLSGHATLCFLTWGLLCSMPPEPSKPPGHQEIAFALAVFDSRLFV